MIFVNTKRQADDLTQVLRDNKWPALCTHGDKEQPERDWVMSEFRKGTHPILIATAVAERGLDINSVTHVINYDCPKSGEEYVHRIGRTGRAGQRGTAITYMTTSDSRMAADIIKIVKDAAQAVPDALNEMESADDYGGGRECD